MLNMKWALFLICNESVLADTLNIDPCPEHPALQGDAVLQGSMPVKRLNKCSPIETCGKPNSKIEQKFPLYLGGDSR